MIIKMAYAIVENENQLIVSVNKLSKYIASECSSLKATTLTVSALTGNSSLSASYSFLSNSILTNPGRLFPKWLLGLESKSYVNTVHDENGNEMGCFYRSQKGIFSTGKWVLDCGIKLDCYSRSYGITRNTFIHKNGVQIAEIVMPLSTTNGFWCFIYLLDEYNYLDKPLILFARRVTSNNGINFSSTSFSGQGMIGARASISTVHTKDVYSKLHDRDWIANNFNIEDITAINSEIAENRELAKSLIRKRPR